MASATLLSDRLDAWLSDDEPKTLGALVEHFGSGSFALLFVLLLAFPALPLPTGGLSHVLELAAMLLALELIIGRREVWLPERWRQRDLGRLAGEKARVGLLKRIRWFERWARPRGGRLLTGGASRRLYGVLVLVLTATAFVAPPFSGLDTLPALGVVVLSLGVLFRDAIIAGIGLGIGGLGVALVVFLGHAVLRLL